MFGVVRQAAVLESGDPCVVDQDVQARSFAKDLRHGRLPMGFFAHVEV